MSFDTNTSRMAHMFSDVKACLDVMYYAEFDRLRHIEYNKSNKLQNIERAILLCYDRSLRKLYVSNHIPQTAGYHALYDGLETLLERANVIDLQTFCDKILALVTIQRDQLWENHRQ